MKHAIYIFVIGCCPLAVYALLAYVGIIHRDLGAERLFSAYTLMAISVSSVIALYQSLWWATSKKKTEATLANKLLKAEAKIEHLSKLLIYEFTGDYPPSFRDGVLHPHELEEVVTAEYLNTIVKAIQERQVEINQLQLKIRTLDSWVSMTGTVMNQIKAWQDGPSQNRHSMPSGMRALLDDLVRGLELARGEAKRK